MSPEGNDAAMRELVKLIKSHAVDQGWMKGTNDVFINRKMHLQRCRTRELMLHDVCARQDARVSARSRRGSPAPTLT